MNLYKFSLFLLPLGMVGCENVGSYVALHSAQSMVIGVTNPYKDTINVSDQLIGSVFLADAAEVSDISKTPIVGAEVSVISNGASLPLNEVEDGFYVGIGIGENVPIYSEGAQFDVESIVDGEAHRATTTAPGPIGFEEEGSCIPADQSLELHFTETGYDDLIIIVYNAQGEETFSSVPSSAGEFVDFAIADESATETYTLPPSAFPADDPYGVFAVGVSGLLRGGTYSENLNSILSHSAIGAMRLGLVTTVCVEE